MKFSSIAVSSILVVASFHHANAKHTKPRDNTSEEHTQRRKNFEIDEDVELVVKYNNDIATEYLKLQANDAKVVKDLKTLKVATITTKRSKIEEIMRDPNVQSVSESHTYFAVPHTRGASIQQEDRKLQGEQAPYGIAMVQADALQQGQSPVTVCVVDTGYGLGHPDLPNSEDHGVDGHSPYYDERWDIDPNSHGTHCAGTIGAIGDNGVGVTSVNPDPNKFSFYIGKGLSDDGYGTTDAILEAVEKCVENGAKVISMSLGCNYCWGQAEEDAYKEVYDKGVLIVAAAGNGGNEAEMYPASYPTVMSVGAVDSDRDIAGFSQFNEQVEISAPGVGVLSTTTDFGDFSYSYYDGTSMATPHVAGVAALVWSHFPDCSNNQIRNVLLKTALDRGQAGCDEYYGYGIVQAKAAYDLLSAEGCEAGGEDPDVLSSAAKGGCEQDPDYVPPPTAAPTPFTCDATTVTIELNTDAYGSETSWELLADGEVQASGSDYESSTDHEIKACVSADTCTFTIQDSFGDGICCGEGDGSYAVTRNGVRFERDGRFFYSQTVDICAASDAPVTPPAPITPAPIDGGITMYPTTTAFPTLPPATWTFPPYSSSGPSSSSTSPPVSSPTSCTGTSIELSIMTDSISADNRAKLKDKRNGDWLLKKEWKDYASPNTLYVESLCVEDSCFQLQIEDKSGDGFGSGGYYSLVVDGQTIVDQHSDIGKKEKTEFCTPVSTSVPSATLAPIPVPTSPAPAPASGCSICDDDEACIQVSVLTDSKPGETRLRIKDTDNNDWVVKGNYGDYSEVGTLYTETICHDDSCFAMIVQDKAKDGFQDGGYYSLVVDGETLVDQKSDFGKVDKTNFCTYTVQEPTPSPTTPASCEDVSSFEFKNQIRDCSWVSSKLRRRCKKFSNYCPVTCDTC